MGSDHRVSTLLEPLACKVVQLYVWFPSYYWPLWWIKLPVNMWLMQCSFSIFILTSCQVCLLTEVFFCSKFLPAVSDNVSLGWHTSLHLPCLSGSTLSLWYYGHVENLTSISGTYSIVLTVLIFEQRMSSTLNFKLVENFTCLTNDFSSTLK